MKATITGTVIEIKKENPFRDHIDISTGDIVKREFAPIQIIKAYVSDHVSGETIGPLPVPYDCVPGQRVEITVTITE